MTLTQQSEKIASLFEIPAAWLPHAVDEFVKQTREGLAHQTDRGMPMIPAFVTGVPNGTEKGTFLAIDLGGTNFRVCSVTLNGDSTFDITQEKAPIPEELMKTTSAVFVQHLVNRIETFIRTHHCETLALETDRPVFKMGFTFSFPVNQTSINRGTLIRWTKGYDIKDAVGKDIVILIQAELDKRNLPVHIAALVNDTVGTLMSRAYTKPGGGQTLIGAIFGTGTNGAYSERIKSIGKFDAAAHPEITEKIMLINTEWGSFDNDLHVLPNTKYDIHLNTLTPNPGYHMFEKRVSGMFLGELLRLCMLDLHSQGLLFVGGVDKHILNTPWSLDTSIPAFIDGDSTKNLDKAEAVLAQNLGAAHTTLAERQAIQLIAKAIGKRSAYLSAIPCAGLILHTKALEKFESIDIGGDGSVVEFYPRFQEMMHEALAQTQIGIDGDKRVSIGIAKDGSGVGAALCALVA